MRIITGVTTFEELSPTRASRGSNHPVFACKHFFPAPSSVFLKFYLNMAVQEDKHLSFCSPRTKDPEQIQI